MNFPLLKKERTIADPIHKIIKIKYQVIDDLLACKEMQRLRDIKQLAGAFFLYPGAEHSRFSHSIGTYHIACQLLNQPSIKEQVNESEQVAIMIAALLHDIGHGMLSHAFELFHPIDHEKYTVQIIKEKSEINTVLINVDPQLPEMIAAIIDHTYPRPFFSQIISSQLDADRMDYLLRDAYFAGLSYGIYDISRIINMALVVDDELVFKQSAISVIENFFTGRYHMYMQLYFHPVSVSFEILIQKWFTRLSQLDLTTLVNDYSYLKPLLEKKQLTNDQHYQFVDNQLYKLIALSSQEQDQILVTLANRFINKRFFDYRVVSADFTCNKSDLLSDVVEIKSALYKRKVSPTELVYIITSDNKKVELSTISSIVKATMNLENQYLYFYID